MMHLCAVCGATNSAGDMICPHHIRREVDWAVANRVFCDLLHRRIEPPPAAFDTSTLFEEFELVAGG